jgi:hypothetical protein
MFQKVLLQEIEIFPKLAIEALKMVSINLLGETVY